MKSLEYLTNYWEVNQLQVSVTLLLFCYNIDAHAIDCIGFKVANHAM